MKRLIFLSFLVFLSTIFLLSRCDIVTNTYKTYNDAVSDRLFERGWLPEIIPSSSFNIITQNDLDSNTSEGEFSFFPNDVTTFSSMLIKLSEKPNSKYICFQYEKDNSLWEFFLDCERGHALYRLKTK